MVFIINLLHGMIANSAFGRSKGLLSGTPQAPRSGRWGNQNPKGKGLLLRPFERSAAELFGGTADP
jgi:hypothetical protein